MLQWSFVCTAELLVCSAAVQQCNARGRLLLSPSTLQSYFQQCKMITQSHGIALMFVDALNGERDYPA